MSHKNTLLNCTLSFYLFKTVYHQEIIIALLGKILLPMLKLGVGIFADCLFANSLLSLKKESLLDHGDP